MDTPITRAEHEEFRRRMESEHERQNHRIGLLEASVKEMSAIAVSVEKLAQTMEGMLREHEKQGKRLETLEGHDGAMWRKVVGYAATVVVGIIIGFLFKQVGIA